MTRRPAAASSGVHSAGSHPSPSSAGPAQRAGGAAPEPHVEGLLVRLGLDGDAVQLPRLALVVDVVLGPQPAQEGEQLVELPAPVAGPHPHGVELGGATQPEDEGDQEPASRQPVEGGELLGQPHGVAPRQDHGRADLEARGVARRVGHGRQGVVAGDGEDVGPPQRVEPVRLEVVHDLGELVARHDRRPGADPDADLHDSGPSVRRAFGSAVPSCEG